MHDEHDKHDNEEPGDEEPGDEGWATGDPDDATPYAFLAHATGQDAAPQTRAARQALHSLYPSVGIILAFDAWVRCGAAAGGFAGWADFVAGLHLDGRPRFLLLLVPDERVGRVTADLIRRFLDAQRPVIAYLGGRLWWVDALIADDETDWKRGWRVVGAEPVTD
jgi:hypothetical protein